MSNRRDFLKISSLASASLLIPNFLKKTNQLSLGQTNTGKILVVVQLSGGNDGLNTVVPFRNDIYYENRPRLGLERSEILEMNDEQGLHPALEGLMGLYDEGALSVVNSVGYPNPNRSHFRSMDIWQSASRSDQYLQSGWIGRYLDTACNNGHISPHKAMELSDSLSLALRGDQLKGLATQNPKTLFQATRDPYIQVLAKQEEKKDDDHPNLDYLHKTLVEASSSAAYLHEKSKIYKSWASYPSNKLGKRLKTIAELIISGSETQVYYVSHSGFDTHVNQKGQQARLLEQYDKGIFAFVQDLKKNDRFKDVCIMTFSEFGRRVKQNAGGGTDHGTANNLFLIGGELKKPGIVNKAPNLQDLDKGDLKFEIDFRRIYADLLNDWLEVDAHQVLGDTFAKLGLV
ncbi:MAG: DUF1501 domain-containing protein [Bacteroidota bacterium]